MIEHRGKFPYTFPYNPAFPRKRKGGGIATSGLWAWYEADSLTGYSDTDPIGTWEDLGPGGRHLTVNVGAPTFETNEVNGHPAVRFLNGENQVGGNLAMPVTQMSVFAVCKTPTVPPGVTQFIAGSIDATMAARGFMLQVETTVDKASIRKCGVATSVGEIVTLNQYILIDFRHQTGLSELWHNGTQQTLTLQATNIIACTPGAGDSLMIGCALGHPTIEVAAAIFYERPLSDTEQQITREVLRVKYALF